MNVKSTKYVLTYSYDGIPKINTYDNYDDAKRMDDKLTISVNENKINIDYIRLEKIELLSYYPVNPKFDKQCHGLHNMI